MNGACDIYLQSLSMTDLNSGMGWVPINYNPSLLSMNLRKSLVLPFLAATLCVSSAFSQSTHIPAFSARWIGTDTLVTAPLFNSNTTTLGNPVYGTVTVTAYADNTRASAVGTANLGIGAINQIVGSASIANGSSGQYFYTGSSQGMVYSSGTYGALIIAQVTNAADLFANVFSYYDNTCAGSFSAGTGARHSYLNPTTILSTGYTGSWVHSCEMNRFDYVSSNNSTLFIRDYTGGLVFVNASSYVNSVTILDEV